MSTPRRQKAGASRGPKHQQETNETTEMLDAPEVFGADASEDVEAADIAKSAAEFINKRSFKKTKLRGNYMQVPDKYRAGGALNPRWVTNTPDGIEKAKHKGYVFPQEVDSRLEKLTRGANILMVTSAENVADYHGLVADRARRMAGREEIEKAHTSGGVSLNERTASRRTRVQ